MQRSKSVDTLCFLVDPIYKDIDLTPMTVLMEYVLPISRQYRSEILVLSEERYKDFLVYKIPFDSLLTQEDGDIEIQISFMSVTMNEKGIVKDCVRKTIPTTVTIIPIAKWADYIPDDTLSPLDQRILKLDAQQQLQIELNRELYETQLELSKKQVDDLHLEDDKLRLSVKGEPIGNGVKIVVPSRDDGEIDGVGDGLLDLDSINTPNTNDTENNKDGFLEL